MKRDRDAYDWILGILGLIILLATAGMVIALVSLVLEAVAQWW